ncbi:MAG: IGHMBP2 family helicase, partial [Chitinophagia bacterium]|nr:IGHMBP2 family helicase [Chitinophagia bacterium]
MDYFKRLQQLLKAEREEDKRNWQEQTLKTTVAERRANGLAWYPIAIKGTEISRADYITIEVERTTHTDIPHQLRFGASAMLFSNHDATTNQLEGTLSWVGGNRLK